MDFPRSTFEGPERRELTTRVAAAALAARDAAERYVELRRRCERNLENSRELLAASRDLRERLRGVVSSYVKVLRADGATPERVLVLVKNAVQTSDLALYDHGGVMEELVRWVVDAYYAA